MGEQEPARLYKRARMRLYKRSPLRLYKSSHANSACSLEHGPSEGSLTGRKELLTSTKTTHRPPHGGTSDGVYRATEQSPELLSATTHSTVLGYAKSSLWRRGGSRTNSPPRNEREDPGYLGGLDNNAQGSSLSRVEHLRTLDPVVTKVLRQVMDSLCRLRPGCFGRALSTKQIPVLRGFKVGCVEEQTRRTSSHLERSIDDKPWKTAAPLSLRHSKVCRRVDLETPRTEGSAAARCRTNVARLFAALYALSLKAAAMITQCEATGTVCAKLGES